MDRADILIGSVVGLFLVLVVGLHNHLAPLLARIGIELSIYLTAGVVTGVIAVGFGYFAWAQPSLNSGLALFALFLPVVSLFFLEGLPAAVTGEGAVSDFRTGILVVLVISVFAAVMSILD